VSRRRLPILIGVLVLIAVSCGGGSEDQPSLAEGDTAPAFSLPSAAGGNVSLSDFAGKKPVLLYFSMGPG
jgi:AhpC/TSA family protein